MSDDKSCYVVLVQKNYCKFWASLSIYFQTSQSGISKNALSLIMNGKMVFFAEKLQIVLMNNQKYDNHWKWAYKTIQKC